MSFAIRKLLRKAAVSAALVLGAMLIVGGSSLTAPFAPAAYAVDGIRVLSNVCAWDDFDWDEMTDAEKRAWGQLGWTAKRWSSDSDAAAPASDSKDWDELAPFERAAAWSLGYTARSWDADCP